MSRFEFLHPILFYAPIALYALGLMIKHRSITLPMLANPQIFAGGAIGESKSDVFELAGPFARSKIAPYATVEACGEQDALLKQAKAAMRDAKLSYPVVAKPDTGLRGAGVWPISCDAQLSDYLAAFPAGRRLVLQRKVEHKAEAGIFYIRHPGQAQGEIFSVTLKYAATVTGDGVSTLEELILADPRAAKMRDIYMARHHKKLSDILPKGEERALNFAGNHARGAIFRDGASYITPALTAAIDRIAKDFPELYFTRLDIRFPDMEHLARGEDLHILEVNGVGSEATHIWDCSKTLREAYRVLRAQWRHAFEIGAANSKRRHKLPSAWNVGKLWIKELLRADDYPLAQ